ncbi:ribulose-phosphate 3-epimerase [Streptococcus pneumoniae GA16531]|nr:ribulose-phosphate 3-epimerase [Streptococcus pneumoniae GA16531]
MQGQIIKALAGFYYVESDGQVYQTRARGNFRKKGHTPYVGDWVDFSAEENSEGYILKIHERKNSLVRPPIVNIDQAVVIMSVKEPDFNSNLLDRFLVLLEHKGIHPIVYISKMDLLEDRGELDFYQQTYGDIGYDFVTSKEELLSLLTGKVTVFMGQTGVGKSTLLNKIAPDLNLETGEISDSLGRGRHTTRAVSFTISTGVKSQIHQDFHPWTMKYQGLKTSIRLSQRLLLLAEIVSSVLVPIPMSRLVPSNQLLKRVLLQPSVLTITCNSLVKLKIVEKPIKKSAKKFQNKEKPMSQYKIAPSILAADYANFEREIKRLEATGAEYAHIDIMDSHFVPQISFGAGVVESLRPHSKMVFDCHLMVSNPEHHLEDFARAGADIISIHVEATPHIHGALQKIRSLGVKPSVVINPGTPVEAIKHVLHLVDQVLVMTVNPGFGGQAFLPETMDKVRELVALREEKGLNFEIEVDGGIDDQTIAQAKEAGATVFVAGSYVFKGEVNERVQTLRKQLD